MISISPSERDMGQYDKQVTCTYSSVNVGVAAGTGRFTMLVVP